MRRYIVPFQISSFMNFCYSISNKCRRGICFLVQSSIRMSCQYLIPFSVMILLLMITVDIQIEQHKFPNEEWILILLGLLVTLRQVKLAFGQRCFAGLRKQKRHSRIPKRRKIHGGQRYPIIPFPERIHPSRSFQYNRVFLTNPQYPTIGQQATFDPNLVLYSKLSPSDTSGKL